MAPAFIASSTSLCSPDADRIRTRADGSRPSTSAVTSTPPGPGICRSSTTTCGRAAGNRGDRLVAVGRDGDDVEAGAATRSRSTASRHIGWSSTTITRTALLVHPVGHAATLALVPTTVVPQRVVPVTDLQALHDRGDEASTSRPPAPPPDVRRPRTPRTPGGGPTRSARTPPWLNIPPGAGAVPANISARSRCSHASRCTTPAPVASSVSVRAASGSRSASSLRLLAGRHEERGHRQPGARRPRAGRPQAHRPPDATAEPADRVGLGVRERMLGVDRHGPSLGISARRGATPV